MRHFDIMLLMAELAVDETFGKFHVLGYKPTASSSGVPTGSTAR